MVENCSCLKYNQLPLHTQIKKSNGLSINDEALFVSNCRNMKWHEHYKKLDFEFSGTKMKNQTTFTIFFVVNASL